MIHEIPQRRLYLPTYSYRPNAHPPDGATGTAPSEDSKIGTGGIVGIVAGATFAVGGTAFAWLYPRALRRQRELQEREDRESGLVSTANGGVRMHYLGAPGHDSWPDPAYYSRPPLAHHSPLPPYTRGYP
jgi:hypothetical protein